MALHNFKNKQFMKEETKSASSVAVNLTLSLTETSDNDKNDSSEKYSIENACDESKDINDGTIRKNTSESGFESDSPKTDSEPRNTPSKSPNSDTQSIEINIKELSLKQDPNTYSNIVTENKEDYASDSGVTSKIKEVTPLDNKSWTVDCVDSHNVVENMTVIKNENHSFTSPHAPKSIVNTNPPLNTYGQTLKRQHSFNDKFQPNVEKYSASANMSTSPNDAINYSMMPNTSPQKPYNSQPTASCSFPTYHKNIPVNNLQKTPELHHESTYGGTQNGNSSSHSMPTYSKDIVINRNTEHSNMLPKFQHRNGNSVLENVTRAAQVASARPRSYVTGRQSSNIITVPYGGRYQGPRTAAQKKSVEYQPYPYERHTPNSKY